MEMIAVKERVARPAVRVGHLERARIITWLSPAIPLLVTLGLNVWNLTQNGYSNLYYSTAVQSMTQSWHNFFFGSYDAGGFITVDKPPVALWMQAISARIFGFSPLSLLLPEALAGVLCVAITYYLVRRVFGVLAAFVAAMAMALTPIAVAMERTNNTDTWLMLALLLAAWALTSAAEKGRLALLALSMALVGVAFNIKMLAAFIVLPAFYLVYMLGAPIKWQKRMAHLALGSVVVFSVALSWPLAVDLTPPDQRPWVGGSQSNSVLELALGYNGLGRVTGQGERFGGRGGMRVPLNGGFRQDGNRFPNPQNGFPPAGGGIQNAPAPGVFGGNLPAPGAPGAPGPFGGVTRGPGGPGNMFGAGEPGPLRLFTGEMAGQWSWLFPLALFGMVAAGLKVRRRLPLDRRGKALLMWGGWLSTYGVVFSVASGIFHPYYLVILAPAAGALVGAGVAAMLSAYRRGSWAAWLLPASLIATAAWQMNVLAGYPQWSAWLTPLLAGGTLLAVAGLVISRLLRSARVRRLSPGFMGTAVVALLLAPAAWSVTPVMAGPSNASLPVAGPEALNQNDPSSWTRMNGMANSPLVAYLVANQSGYFYLAAVTNSQQASSIALSTGKPVLAAGGFMGSDPALTVERLQEMIANKQVRFVMEGMGMGMGMGGAMGRGGPAAGMGGALPGIAPAAPANAAGSSVSSWVQANCSAVDPSLYSGAGTGSTNNTIGGFGGFFGLGNSQLYDCAAR